MKTFINLNYDVLPKEEIKKLFIEYKHGNLEAKNKIIKHNLRFVYSLAKKCSFGNSFYLEEFFSEGTIGLIRAVELFDLNYNVEFITYASYYIRQKIQRCFLQKYIIHIPQRVLDELRELENIEKNSEIPLNYLIENSNNKEHLFYAQKASNITSLNIKISKENGTFELIDLIEDNSKPLENQVMENILKNSINEELKRILSKKEFIILKLHMNKFTLKEIGKRFGLVPESIRQRLLRINKKILKSKILKEYWDSL